MVRDDYQNGGGQLRADTSELVGQAGKGIDPGSAHPVLDETHIAVLLSGQRALLGEVFPSLDAVDVSWSTGVVKLKFFLSSPPSEKDEESMSAIETEMITDFWPDKEVLSEYSLGERSAAERGAVCIFARSPHY